MQKRTQLELASNPLFFFEDTFFYNIILKIVQSVLSLLQIFPTENYNLLCG